MPKSTIVIDAQLVSSEVAVQLRKASDGHYFIARAPKRQGSATDYFRVSEHFAKKLMKLSVEAAWAAIERFVGVV